MTKHIPWLTVLVLFCTIVLGRQAHAEFLPIGPYGLLVIIVDWLLYSLGGWLLFSFAFWLLYVNFYSLKSRRGKHPVYAVLYYLTGVVGLPVDVIYHATVGPLLFLELKWLRRGEWTFTGRLRRHVLYGKRTQWRHQLAVLICKRLVEPWDDDHCALSRIGR